jgi:hypothetical protein
MAHSPEASVNTAIDNGKWLWRPKSAPNHPVIGGIIALAGLASPDGSPLLGRLNGHSIRHPILNAVPRLDHHYPCGGERASRIRAHQVLGGEALKRASSVSGGDRQSCNSNVE